MPPPNNITVDDIGRAPESLPAPPNAHAQENLTNALQHIATLSDNIDKLKEEKSILKDELAELKRNKNTAATLDKLIEPYAKRTYWFMVGYCSFVGAMLFLSAQKGSDVIIDPDVMKILVGSTAVTVIGLVGMILTGVFIGARKS